MGISPNYPSHNWSESSIVVENKGTSHHNAIRGKLYQGKNGQSIKLSFFNKMTMKTFQASVVILHASVIQKTRKYNIMLNGQDYIILFYK